MTPLPTYDQLRDELNRLRFEKEVLLMAVRLAIGFTVSFREEHPDAVIQDYMDVGRLYAMLDKARNEVS